MVSLTHKFVSAKGDDSDPTLIQPSNWNDQHVLTAAANSVVGNPTSATAQTTDVPMGTIGQAILASNTEADLIAAGVALFSTGDAKFTLKTVADAGWVIMNDGTMGNTSSGATFAGTQYQALYTLLWNNISNSWAPVTGGRGASAANDWTAQKPIQLLRVLGRSFIVAGQGSGLNNNYSLGQTFGEEGHTLSQNEMPSHNHGVNDFGHGHGFSNNLGGLIGFGPGGGGSTGLDASALSASTPFGFGVQSNTTGISIQATGGGTSHNTVHPVVAWHVMLKL